MENFLNLVKKRYSVRDFLPEPVEEQKLQYILECGRLAPSAANYQPWHVIVVRDPEVKKKLASTYSRSWFAKAPIILVICGNHQLAWKRSDGNDHTDVDVSIIIDHMTLAAAEIGLGTCWICNFDVVKAKEILGLPDHVEPIVYLPLGYPQKGEEHIHPHHNKRKLIAEIIHWEKF